MTMSTVLSPTNYSIKNNFHICYLLLVTYLRAKRTFVIRGLFGSYA